MIYSKNGILYCCGSQLGTILFLTGPLEISGDIFGSYNLRDYHWHFMNRGAINSAKPLAVHRTILDRKELFCSIWEWCLG